MKGVSSLLSLVLYTAIMVVAVGLVLNVAMPALENMQDSSAIESSINFLTGMDDVISEVASGTEGASRTVTLTFQRGSYRFDNSTEELYYRIETRSGIVSSHAVQERGSVTISADADVSVEETEVNGTDCYMMENQHLEACIRKIPEEFDPADHPNLVGFWRMDEGSGQWANDSSRYGNDATLGPGPSSTGEDPDWVPGIHGNGLSFNTSTFANASDSAHLDVTGNVTLTAWINSSGNETGVIARKGGAYGLWSNGSTASFQAGGQNVSASTGDGWVHVAGVYNGTVQELYVGGKPVKTRQNPASVSQNDEDLLIGRGFNGSIDSVRVYNRTLTGEEVEWIHLQRGDESYVNTSRMLVQLHNKDLDEDLNASLTTFINGNSSLAAGTGFTDADVGETLGRGRVVLNVTSGDSYRVAYDLISGADFLTLKTSGASVDNTTHILEMVLDNRAGDGKYVDGQQRSGGLYSDVDFGYAAGESGGRVAGLVQGTDFETVGFDPDAGKGFYGFNLTTRGDTAFLPFTEGGHGVIEGRESVIQGGLFGRGNFLGFPSPNFAYELTKDKTVRVALSFDNIVLNGFESPVSKGTYDITVSNVGVRDGEAVVNLTVG